MKWACDENLLYGLKLRSDKCKNARESNAFISRSDYLLWLFQKSRNNTKLRT